MDKQGIPVFGVELHLPDQAPLTRHRPKWKVIQADPEKHILWQKEALLNIALAMVPAEYTAIAWIDPDIEFTNPHWVSQTEQALQCWDVVQPYDSAIWTHEDGTIEGRRYAAAKVGMDRRWLGHPGFAWASRREVLTRAGGFYPYCLLGNGDTLMALGFFGQALWDFPGWALGSRHDKYYAWRCQVGAVTTGYVAGSVWHEWHGNRQDRRYSKRVDEVKDHDLPSCVNIDESGLLSWHPDAPATLKENMAHYFTGRKEDG